MNKPMYTLIRIEYNHIGTSCEECGRYIKNIAYVRDNMTNKVLKVGTTCINKLMKLNKKSSDLLQKRIKDYQRRIEYNYTVIAKVNNIEEYLEAKINPKRRLYLTILITELSLSASHNFDYREANDSITDIIHYINDHLTQPLNIHTLCKKFFISKQHLYRKFENATGSTVWRYIVTKRLLLARELIVNGVAANEACVKSGFNDYSTFYKSYRAQFGHSPKDDLVSKKDD